MSLAMGVSPGTGESLPLFLQVLGSMGQRGEVLQGERTNGGNKLPLLNIQLLGGSKPTQMSQESPTTAAQGAPNLQRVPVRIQPH